jgi:hypothetical protein
MILGAAALASTWWLGGGGRGIGAPTTQLPVHDAHVAAKWPDRNYGAASTLVSDGSPVLATYLMFDLRALTEPVPRATLRMYKTNGSAGLQTIWNVEDDNWTEATLTYRHRPPRGTAAATFVPGTRSGSWVDVDVTAAVAAGVGTLLSLSIDSPSSDDYDFKSKESTSDRPQLVLEPVTTTTTAAPTTTTTAGTPPPPGPAGSLHSTATQAFVDANGNEVRLRGFNVIPVWGNSPGQTWDSAKYTQIRSKGFNAVRFVLYWDDFEPSRGTWNQTNLTTLDTAVSRATSAGLYVILDMIHLWGSGGFNDVPAWAKTGDSVTTVQTNGAGYLKMLAGRYHNQPMVAAYDLVNEFYRSPIDQNGVLRAYDSLITQVRTVDPAKIIMIEPSYGDSSIAGSLADFANLTNKANVVWSLHDYFGGGDDDGYDASGAQTGTYLWNGTTGYSSPNLTQLENHLLVHVNKTRAAGIPMWIGELGIGSGVANHDLWIDHQIGLFNKYGLGFAWWEYYTTGPLSATNSDFTWKPWVDRLLAGTTTPPP